jgi:mRNA-degrading endonuclease RelE of RelBE toxin-antitoxin system
MMRVKVGFASQFLKEIERLARKYPQAPNDLQALITQLKDGERPGDKIPNIGYDVYKVRLKNTSAGRGKRGGFRAIYYYRVADNVIMISIYSKTEQEDISAEVIRRIIEDYSSSASKTDQNE